MNRKKVVIGTIAVIAVVLGVVSLLKFGSFIFIVPVFIYFSNWLHNELRIDVWLARAVVAFMILPFLFSIKAAVANKEETQKKGLIGLGILSGMCFLGLFFYSFNSQFFDPQTGEPIKWYAETTSEGIRFFDEPGFDPKYGVELQPVTEEVVVKSREVYHQGISFKLKEIEIPVPALSFSQKAEGAERKTSLGLAPVENYNGWVTVMDVELSPDRWTEPFYSLKYAKWKAYHQDGIEVEIDGREIKKVNLETKLGRVSKIRFKGNGHLILEALPW